MVTKTDMQKQTEELKVVEKTKSRYHVNPKTLRVNICKAKIKCEFGDDTPHFDTKEEAKDYYDKKNKSKNIPESMSKSPKVELVDEGVMNEELDNAQDWSNFEPTEDDLRDFGGDFYEEDDLYSEYSEYDDDDYYEDERKPASGAFKFSFDD